MGWLPPSAGDSAENRRKPMTAKTQVPWYVTWCIQAHGNQMYGSEPYEYHQRAVAELAISFGFTDEYTQMLCWAHDVAEDCINPRTGLKYTREDFIEAGFPAIVAEAILAITDKPGANRTEIKANTLPGIAAFRVSKEPTGFSVERPVVVAKLCDRGCNLRQGKAENSSKYRRNQREHPHFVATLYDPKEVELQPLWDYVNSLVVG
jgi:(p)ppGpp synthase/HD superfamily hydrolase